MKTWDRGRKRLTPEERKLSEARQTERVRIANLVARKPEIEKKCCICGNSDAQILHNTEDPYYITFICNDCRKEPSNLILAEERRFDIRTYLDKNNLSINNFTDTEVIRIVIGYMNERKSIGEYCEEMGISRYQFNQLVDRCAVLLPKQPIKQLVTNRSKAIKAQQLRKMTERRMLKN